MKKVIVLAATLTMCVFTFVPTVNCEPLKVIARASSVLSLIETYEAPAYPQNEIVIPETYDFRKKSGARIPPTLTDALIADLWQRMTMDLKIQGITIYRVSEDHVIQAMNIYIHRDWRHIAGYRPWTHWNFIRSLSKQEKDRLAKEVVAYMHDNGVNEGE